MIKKLNVTSLKNITLATFMVNELNKLLAMDSVAVNRLFGLHVPCSTSIVKHPTFIVDEKNKLGVLGILNGFVGKDAASEGLIVAVTDSTGKIIKFKVSKN